MAPPFPPSHGGYPDYPGDHEFDPRDYDDGPEEPVGSCEWCGTNLYPGDDLDLCDQCFWLAERTREQDDEDEEDDRQL
jgi:hypothetical protein